MGSPGEDQLRLDQLRGARDANGWMLRSAADLLAPLHGPSWRIGGRRGCDVRWSLVAPSAALTWNSRLPFERNDGGAWTARGITLHGAGGIRAECGRLRVVVVPDGWIAQNRPFALLTSQAPGRSAFVHPFYGGREASMDMPLRFGTQTLIVAQAGQSFADLDLGPASVTVGSQSLWWGPGIRNALVMSNHAAPIPAVSVRTTRPLRSAIGRAEARWMIGALTESPFFDQNVDNDIRSLSGLVVTLSPAFDSTLTLGLARVIYAQVSGVSALPPRFFDAVARWGPGGDVRRAGDGGNADQLTSVFARWLFPRAGFEGYVEWARVVLPSSLRDLLLAPQYSQGFTVGSQWLSSADTVSAAWRAQLEATMNEQPRFESGEPPAFYVSPSGGHGYTQRGRVIGAMIGPGANAQFLALDRQQRGWSAGVLFGRTRWNNEQYYRRPTSNLSFAHDVSVYSGLRGWRIIGPFHLSAELIRERRMNFLSRSAVGGYGEDHTFDVHNTSLRVAITPFQ